jgi:hypothetical protein
MGGSSASKGSSNTTNQIPPELSGLTSKTAKKVGEVQDQPGFDVGEYGKPHVQNVPGLAGGQQEAIRQAYGVGAPSTGTTNAYSELMAAPQWASQSGRATGGTLATDPSLAAAYNAYKSNVEPDLQSQFGLMGLGKSSLMGDALAKGAASQMQPAIEGSLAREQAANENRIGRETSTALNTASQYAGLGGQDINQRLQSLNALMQTGGMERGIGSEQSQAEQQDYLRQQGLAERGTYGVLGQLPSTLGQTVTSKTSGGGK